MKHLLKALPTYFKYPWKIKSWFLLRKLDKKKSQMSVKDYLTAKFKIDLGYPLDLDNPKTFNEKMQWLKLYNQNPLFTEMADKHAVKAIVSNKIGADHVAKEYACASAFEQIDFRNLPDTLVIKTTHGFGPITICRNKCELDFDSLKEIYNRSLKENYFNNCYEWPYKNIKPQIICEELLVNQDYKFLPVFKFFCFGGEPLIAQIILNDKQENETIDYIDMDFNYLKLNQGYPNTKKKNRILKPANFDEMKTFAKKMSEGFPFLRCDFYSCNGKTYFSEFTFFSDAGFARFHPKKWDRILGDKIQLPSKKVVESQY